MACTAIGLVLAGGRGRRMGGVDKGLVTWMNRPLAAWSLDVLRPQVQEVWASVSRNVEDYQALGFERLLGDGVTDYSLGPLGGIQSALRELRGHHAWLAVAPCDTPALPEDLVPQLLQSAHKRALRAAFALTQQQGTAYEHVLHCVLRADLLDHLEAFLAKGGRRVSDWMRDIGAESVLFHDHDRFLNVNDLRALSGGT